MHSQLLSDNTRKFSLQFIFFSNNSDIYIKQTNKVVLLKKKRTKSCIVLGFFLHVIRIILISLDFINLSCILKCYQINEHRDVVNHYYFDIRQIHGKYLKPTLNSDMFKLGLFEHLLSTLLPGFDFPRYQIPS